MSLTVGTRLIGCLADRGVDRSLAATSPSAIPGIFAALMRFRPVRQQAPTRELPLEARGAYHISDAAPLNGSHRSLAAP
jgi:hypothetical protein